MLPRTNVYDAMNRGVKNVLLPQQSALNVLEQAETRQIALVSPDFSMYLISQILTLMIVSFALTKNAFLV